MAIAKQQFGVTRGYKAKTKRLENSSAFHQALTLVRAGARQMCEFLTDEIVYATMDTARLLNSLQYELGFRTRARVEPVVHDLEQFVHDHELLHDNAALAAEKIRA